MTKVAGSLASNVWAQVVLFIGVLAGFVALVLTHQDTAAYLGLVTPVLGSIVVVGHLEQRSDAQDQALTVITKQTNGVLTQRIKDAVTDALAEQSPDAGPDAPAPIVAGPPPEG